jgi:two-component system phosphate regulon sensor histidine kinase PhoR
MRKDFVANVSHELRTPLSIIKGYVETLLEEPRPDPETADSFLRTIQRHSARLETLIGDLLTISALESPAKQLSLTSVTLRTVAETARDELAPQAAAKRTRLDIEIPRDLPTVPGDASRLHQVFVNLLDNAIKYTPPGSRVTVTATETPTELIVCVADNGPGIPPEHLDRIFERFYRVDKARSRDVGGTGLGLSIVKHIVQAHQGRVWAESEPDKGSRFYFTLPKT